MDGTFNVTERLRRESIYEQAFAKFGLEKQRIVAIEELSELQKEVCKYLRGNGNPEHLAEEIADVRIMVEQLELMHGCRKEVGSYMRKKIRRLQTKLEE